MVRVEGDDIRVWIFILSVTENQWRILSRRTGRMKAAESRMMPRCWRQYCRCWSNVIWLLSQPNLLKLVIIFSISLNIFSHRHPGILCGICHHHPLFTHGNSCLIPWYLPFSFSPSLFTHQVLSVVYSPT